MSPLRRILQHGVKRGDFNPQERAHWRIAKICYVHSLRELTVNAVLPGIHDLLVDLRVQQISGLASVSLNADDFSSAGAARVFSPSARTLPQLKIRNRTRKSFSPPVQGWACRQACIGIEDAQAGIEAINASGMRSVGIGAGLTGAQLLPSTDS